MGFQKKHGKDRLDKWYKLAKEKGYRARAAFKLIQLNRKHGFLQKSKVLLDLCAAPGSWCQVASESMPNDGLIVGVDIVPIKSIPRVITIQGDITGEKCKSQIRGVLKTWDVDTVIHDGAPNVGTAWVQDAFSQAELVLQATGLAVSFLKAGGTFVTKVFRSKDYNALLWVLQQLFANVEATKPPASRNISAEIYVVCKGFRAPKHVDPRFLDPRHVFAELPRSTRVDEASIWKPQVKKRKREGYAENDWTQHREANVVDFLESEDPVPLLATLNRLTFQQPGPGFTTLSVVTRLPDTSEEVRECCQDLKILGRKEFRMLLRWRLQCRHALGLTSEGIAQQLSNESQPKHDPGAHTSNEADHDRLSALTQRMLTKERKRKRKENQIRQRDIRRMHMHMQPPTDIGLARTGISGSGIESDLVSHGRPYPPIRDSRTSLSFQSNASSNSSVLDYSEHEDETDRLESELDYLHDQYKNGRRNQRVGNKDVDECRSTGLRVDNRALTSDDGNATCSVDSHLSNLKVEAHDFYSREPFGGIDGLKTLNSVPPRSSSIKPSEKRQLVVARRSQITSCTSQQRDARVEQGQGALSALDHENVASSSAGIHVAGQARTAVVTGQSRRPLADQRADIRLVTAEAMALAQQVAGNRTASSTVTDNAFNKYAFDNSQSLPRWFVENEREFNRPVRPISPAAAEALRKRVQALNSRPTKKVREAKQRKKVRAARRLQKSNRSSMGGV